METIPAKNIIMKNKNPNQWFGAEYNMNIYRGCSHGCIYCDSRSDCYRNPDFDIIKVKQDALEIIRDDLRRKVKKGVVSTGAMSDPYNPLEEKYNLTRKALELINTYGFGVAIDTKGSLVARDIDILKEIQEHSPVIVKMSITIANDELCKKVEPNAPTTEERFAALKQLSDAGIFCGILMMPLLPFINDTVENVESIMLSAKNAGVNFVYPSFGLTLRPGNREYYYEQLDKYFPGLKEKYVQTYGTQYYCNSFHTKKLWQVFLEKSTEYGLLYEMGDIIHSYKNKYENQQLSFF